MAKQVTVLVVEDDPVVRGVLCRMVESMGYRPKEAPNGAEAIADIARDSPDLILLDLVLPDTGRLDVLRFLQECSGQSRVLVMTGYGPQQIARLDLPPDTLVIYKPFSSDRLEQAIRSALGEGAAPM